MINKGLSIPINGKRYPMVFVDYRFAYCDAVFGLDDRRDDLMKQVEQCANKLKRYDYQKIVLTKLHIEDANLIKKIADWFENEDIDVICVYTDQISKEEYAKICNQFNIINSWYLMGAFEEEKNNGYKKSL